MDIRDGFSTLFYHLTRCWDFCTGVGLSRAGTLVVMISMDQWSNGPGMIRIWSFVEMHTLR